MVLNRLFALALVVTGCVTGCGKSLFDNSDGDDAPPSDASGGDGPPVQTSCAAPCLGDASGDFDGSPGGANGRWRYLDDLRDRTWIPMTGGATKTGAGMNKITSCAETSAAACSALPGALLVTSTGATSGADPAIELTIADAKVAALTLRVHVPTGGAAQVIRLYRNSREDVLFSGLAMAGTTLDHAIAVDALPGDRFLLAVAPTSGGTPDVAVQMFASDTQMTFPQQCQLAASFEPATITGTRMRNLCGGATDTLVSMNDEVASGPDVEVAPMLTTGPFAEQGMAGDFVEGRYYDSTVVSDHARDFTWQFWFKFDAFITSLAFMMSDIDVTNGPAGGGYAVDLYIDAGNTLLESVSVVDGTNPEYAVSQATYLNPNAWHFIRLVQRGSDVLACVDGVRVFMYSVAAGTGTSSKTVRLARNQFNPQEALLDGQLDDVRVFKGVALPCQ